MAAAVGYTEDRVGHVDREAGGAAVWDKSEDMIVHEHDPYNAEAARGRLADVLTATRSFYVRNHGDVPLGDERTWRLVVDGLVDHPLELSLEELRTDWATREVTATLQCAGNRRAGFLEVRDIPGEDPWGPGAISTARWVGVRLKDLLDAAVPTSEARHVAFEASDTARDAAPPQPYGGSIDLAKARSDEVLLAWSMNDEPLPPVHGGPLRVVVPGYIGARSVKWLRRITVQAEPSENYFQATAYRLLPEDVSAAPGVGIPLASLALTADVISPAPDAHVAAGVVDVSGYAFAGDDRAVVRVDVSLDEGTTWQQAVVEAPVSPWTWQQWKVGLEVPPGDHVLVVRAWDSTGACMPESARHLWNPKGYVNNSWARQALHAS